MVDLVRLSWNQIVEELQVWQQLREVGVALSAIQSGKTKCTTH
ncbi:MAG: hypothetical protein UT12_C0026G0002 [Candidatus Curtissbacteria bacterium GW2011_GWC2_38_9]|uniref:Uncharacterized protein n=1 Tax=Candidatus Curtissbacteria bacterium GW2011_GWC2_38_9 TaxID=1618414 RepID=A0A0G0LJN3_9BACT|nr:MAG: hypothetical protein UT12_C0026G0002 [Candidatus Curtissbacteria bacterium GW2011_GWC2_38_9]